MHILFHTAEHAFTDSIKILPFIFLVYMLIEYLEHINNTDLSHLMMKSKKSGIVLGGLLGIIPQCGFSVIAADLFSKKSISMGALVAIFIATSDEAIPILLSNQQTALALLKVIPLKLAIAIVTGFLVDIIFKTNSHKHVCTEEHHHEHFHGNCESCDGGILKSTIVHTLKIFAFIFVSTFIIDFIIEYSGKEVLFELLLKDSPLQPFIASLIGLIPNCASSVILTQSYVSRALSLGALIAGLCSGSGVGLLLLFKRNHNLKENLKILSVLYFSGAIFGTIIHLVF